MNAPACPTCKTALRSEARFCDACGARVSDTAAPLAPPPPGQKGAPRSTPPMTEVQAALPGAGVEGERKTITALFADIKGSMALIEDLDPEDAGKIVDPAMQLMMDAVHRFDGTVAQAAGDGIFAMFGAPVAHEDHAHRALFAALRMQGDVAAYAKELRRERGVTLQIRVGVNTGEVVLRSVRRDDLHADYSPVGHSTGLAARMEQLADPGTIVVSEHTHKLTDGYFLFRALGPARVKGLTAPIQIYELTGVGALRTRLDRSLQRGLVPFVGRSDELERLRAVLARAASGEGQLIRIEGEAGIGKSRLTYELRLLAQSRFGVLAAAAASHKCNEPYATVIELLHGYFDLQPGDETRQRREKITGRLLTLDRALEDALPYVCMLLGGGEFGAALDQMDPTIRRQRTQDALIRVLLRESAEHPVLLIVEDLHWLDAESQAVLEGVTSQLAAVSVALVVNYRPEYQHDWNAPHQTHLRLTPLDHRDGEQLLRALLGPQPALDPLKRQILDRTGGNPFFIEEIVQSLRELGVVADGVRPAATDTAVPTLHIPASVHDVLAARIDRLPPADKALLQSLAVLGRQFPLALAVQVTGSRADELAFQLDRLQAAEFLGAPSADGDAIFRFKHALTQEVAYGTLLLERRRDLHRRTAQAIEAIVGSRIDEHYGELAHHYRLAGENEKAVDYLQLAGHRALQRSAYADAVHHLSAAVTLLRTGPELPARDQQELLLEISLGRALMLTEGWASAAAERVYARARILAGRVGDTPHIFPALGGLFGFYVARGDFGLARELAAQAVDLAERFGHGVVTRWGQYMMAQVCFYMGEFETVRTLLQPWLGAGEPGDAQLSATMGVEDFIVGSLAHLAPTFWYLGYPDQAVVHARAGCARARQLAHPFSTAYALIALAQVHQFRGESAATRQCAEELITVSEESGLLFRDAGVVLRGWARTQEGDLVEGIEEMRQGLADLRAKGAALRAPNLGRIAEALGRSGDVDEGLHFIDSALAIVQRTGERQSEALLLRTRGDLLLRHGVDENDAVQEAEQCFRRAITVAQEQHAKSLELQASVSLARLWRSQGRERAARELLSPIYAWFTEGFDTRDVGEAKQLLAALDTE